MKATVCPNCGANIEVRDASEFEKCDFCGTSVKVREVIRYEQNYDIPEWFKIADVAYKAGNYEEAYSYYNKILEEETIHSQAWIGKGLCAGRLSEPENNRLAEMDTLIKEGFEHIKDHSKFEYKPKLIKEIFTIYNKNLNQLNFWKPNDRIGYERKIQQLEDLNYNLTKTMEVVGSNDIELLKTKANILKIILLPVKMIVNGRSTLLYPDKAKFDYFLNELKEIEIKIKQIEPGYIEFKDFRGNLFFYKIGGKVFLIMALSLVIGVAGIVFFILLKPKETNLISKTEKKVSSSSNYKFNVVDEDIKKSDYVITVLTSKLPDDTIKVKNFELYKKYSENKKLQNLEINYFNDSLTAVKYFGKKIVPPKKATGNLNNLLYVFKFDKKNNRSRLYKYENGALVIMKQ
ncbi:MAG TPA: hypothetical protein PLG90_00570 [Ignavibacteria bacterium]|nr:hypothetical protein [Ignavibacteria bacterium]